MLNFCTVRRMMTIRPYSGNDDVECLTRLLHRAYAPLAARGLHFMATHQSSDVTLRRLLRGYPLVAESGGQLIGTITVYGPDAESEVPQYRDASSFHFGQLGVDPDFKGMGVGRSLHDSVVRYAMGNGGRFMCLDTASPADDLVTIYQRWGYVIVDRMCFASVNYESVIMRRDLRGPESNG